jgi:hypothetical protein
MSHSSVPLGGAGKSPDEHPVGGAFIAPPTPAGVDVAIAAAGAFTLAAAVSEPEVLRALVRIRRGDEKQGPLIWDLHAGLLAFLSSAFPQAPRSILYGQVFTREPMGRGAHFDVYDGLLHPEFPWVALFNLEGDAVVTVCRLPQAQAAAYERAYPEASDAAYAERRRVSDEVLADPAARPSKGYLLAGSGLIIPQLRGGADWIHNIVPVQAQSPGRFVKFAALAGDGSPLRDRGYALLDELLRHALSNAPADAGESEHQPRRRCNLD